MEAYKKIMVLLAVVLVGCVIASTAIATRSGPSTTLEGQPGEPNDLYKHDDPNVSDVTYDPNDTAIDYYRIELVYYHDNAPNSVPSYYGAEPNGVMYHGDDANSLDYHGVEPNNVSYDGAEPNCLDYYEIEPNNVSYYGADPNFLDYHEAEPNNVSYHGLEPNLVSYDETDPNFLYYPVEPNAVNLYEDEFEDPNNMIHQTAKPIEPNLVMFYDGDISDTVDDPNNMSLPQVMDLGKADVEEDPNSVGFG